MDFLNWAVDFLNWAVDFRNGGCVLSGLGSGEFTRGHMANQDRLPVGIPNAAVGFFHSDLRLLVLDLPI